MRETSRDEKEARKRRIDLRSGCAGKFSYPNGAAAHKKLAAIRTFYRSEGHRNTNGSARFTCMAYRCEFCGLWHIGSLNEDIRVEQKSYRHYGWNERHGAGKRGLLLAR